MQLREVLVLLFCRPSHRCPLLWPQHWHQGSLHEIFLRTWRACLIKIWISSGSFSFEWKLFDRVFFYNKSTLADVPIDRFFTLCVSKNSPITNLRVESSARPKEMARYYEFPWNFFFKSKNHSQRNISRFLSTNRRKNILQLQTRCYFFPGRQMVASLIYSFLAVAVAWTLPLGLGNKS